MARFQRRGPRKFRPKPGERWICAKCGSDIEELPFPPSGNRPIYHRECLPPRP